MTKKTKRVKKIQKSTCFWCRKNVRLTAEKRLVAHPSLASDNWEYASDPSRCPGSGVNPKNWKPKPITTQPKRKTRRRKVKK